MERIPSNIFINTSSSDRRDKSSGEVVKNTIEEAKEELRNDQEGLKNRVYKK